MQRRLIVVALLLVVLLMAADFVAKALAQYWVSREVATALNLSERPAVSIPGFPFLPRLMSGELRSVSIRMQNVTENAVTLQSISLSLHEVRFSPAKFLSGHQGTITAAQADGAATITAAEV